MAKLPKPDGTILSDLRASRKIATWAKSGEGSLPRGRRARVGWGHTCTMSDHARSKLLIVDDEPDMLDFLERVLRSRFAVSRTQSSVEALGWLAEGSFEVLVTDQKMPRLSGLQLLERLGDACPRLVKVLISGFTEVPEIERALEQGRLHNYVLKPVDGERLIEAIDEAYEVRDGRRRPPTEPPP